MAHSCEIKDKSGDMSLGECDFSALQEAIERSLNGSERKVQERVG